MGHTILPAEYLSSRTVIISGNNGHLRNTPTTVNVIISYRHIKNNTLSMTNINLTEQWENKQRGLFITPVAAIGQQHRLTPRTINTWCLPKVGQQDD